MYKNPYLLMMWLFNIFGTAIAKHIYIIIDIHLLTTLERYHEN